MPDVRGGMFAVSLFVGFVILWAIQRRAQTRRSGVDPEVMGRSHAPVQRYFHQLTNILRALIVLLILAHVFLSPRIWGLERLGTLDNAVTDWVGLVVGVAGLALCRTAQVTMRDSWRVGIDEEHETDLVTQGVYAFVRNPTYTGLFLFNAGLWLIRPTWPVLAFAFVFVLLLEVQVRAEEQSLLERHGDVYRDYMARTKRYLPGVY